MLRLATDEDLRGAIVRGLFRRKPDLDLIRIQDSPVSGEDDPIVLAWCAQEGRVLFSHDRRTMPRFGKERVVAGMKLPGLFIVPRRMGNRKAIEEILILAECSLQGEWEGQIRFLPL